MWFYDAITLGDGTVGGTAKVVTDALLTLPKNEQPWWLKHSTKDQAYQAVVQALADSYTSCVCAQDYIDKQTEKGRSIEAAYDDIKPIIEASSRSPIFPDPGPENEEEAAKLLDEQLLLPMSQAEQRRAVDREALEAITAIGGKMSDAEVLKVQRSTKRSSRCAPHKRILNREECADVPRAAVAAGVASSSSIARCFNDTQSRFASARRRHQAGGRRRASRGEEESATGGSLLVSEQGPPDEPAREPPAEPFATIPEEAAVASTPPKVEDFLREPLMLLGTPNCYDKAKAAETHRMSFRSGRKPTPGRQESRIRLKVPAEGMSFQVVSAERPESLVLCPGDGPRELLDGERSSVAVQLKAGDAGQHPSFIVDGAGEEGEVEIRVSLSADEGAQVWFIEA